MQLAALTRPGLIFPDLDAPDRATLLRALANRLFEQGAVADSSTLFAKLWEREELGSTAIGGGVAIPHCKVDRLDEVVMAVAVASRGIDFGALDGETVRLFFCIVSPSKRPAAHLQCLAAISRWVKADPRNVERLMALDDPQAIYTLLAEFDGAEA